MFSLNIINSPSQNEVSDFLFPNEEHENEETLQAVQDISDVEDVRSFE